MSVHLTLELASAKDAGDLAEIIHAAFAARPPVEPPPAALTETPATITAALERGLGLLARVDDQPAGTIIISRDERRASLHRVSVHPRFQGLGVAGALVEASVELLADEGCETVELMAREEFPQVISWWHRRGFSIVAEVPHGVLLGRRLPVAVEVPTAEAMHDLGRRLAGIVQPGDVIIATGDLGAGKTTLTQGLGAGLDVDGPVISPTFVLSRVHAPRGGRPGLVHVDAYRLSRGEEIDDLDLEESMVTSVTMIEWGAGLAEGLSTERLLIAIRRSADPDDECRTVYLSGVGDRWEREDLQALARSLVREDA